MNNLLRLLSVVSSHGIKGDVKVRLYLEDATFLENDLTLYDKDGDEVSFLFKRLVGGNRAIFNIGCIDDRSDADKLVGNDFFIMSDLLPSAGENEFYCRDLVGMSVYLHEDAIKDKPYGVVRFVHDFGAGSIIEVFLHDQKRDTVMLQFSKDVFIDVDVKANRANIKLPKYLS